MSFVMANTLKHVLRSLEDQVAVIQHVIEAVATKPTPPKVEALRAVSAVCSEVARGLRVLLDKLPSNVLSAGIQE
jgi:hypothetical protein